MNDRSGTGVAMRSAKGATLGYFILRTGEQYGPYSHAELRRYLRTGDIYPGDLGRSEEMKEWLPVSQVLGTGAPPLPSLAAGASTIEPPPRTVLATPEPPGLHWGVVLLLVVLTFGLFGWIWSVVIAGWVQKIDPRSRAPWLLISCFAMSIVAVSTFYLAPDHAGLGSVLAQLAAVALFILAIFGMRRSIMAYYCTNQGIPLSLNSAMTLFFNVVYFQFKFNRMPHAKTPTQLMMLHHS